MANPITTSRSSVSIYNLTDDSILAGAPAVRTPIETDPFVLKNTINFANVGSSAPTLTSQIGNVLQVLKIPKNVAIDRVLFSAPTTTAPAHAWSSAASVSKSAVVMNVGYTWYTTASQSSSSIVTDVDALADLAVTAGTGALAASTPWPTVSASTPWTRAVNMSDTGAPTYPHAFPYGGFMELQLSGGASMSSISAKFTTGTLEITAICHYTP